MGSFTVNASLTRIAWVTVEADSADEAFEKAQGIGAYQWETDAATGELEFNVSPQVTDEGGVEA